MAGLHGGVAMRRIALAVLVAVAVLPAIASAQVTTRRGMHDARYCELFELRGAPPDASATVWNTIGLNDCPQATWDALDVTTLAQERGAGAIIRNGPRHFLMDSARAEV